MMLKNNKKILIFFILICLQFCIITAPDWLKINGITPCWPVILLLPFALKNSPVKAVLASFLLGIFIDSFTKSGFGIGGTYIGKIPYLRIDYIWHDKGLDSYNFKTHQNQLSDHKAISVEILLR